MLLNEWDWDKAKAVWQDEAREEGIAYGMQKGMQKGMQQGMQKGQNYVLDLLRQGYSAAEIEKRLNV